MGDRGPKPDVAQAAKGFPGRRRSRAQIASDQAARVAELLALTPASGTELPAMLTDPKYAPAAQVWMRLAPELRRTHRLPKESEFFFVQLCVYAQEWVSATEDLHLNGFSQSIKTVAGGRMERRRPKTLDRQQAYSNCLELSGRFGLTPTDMYALFKGQGAVAPTHPGLFGGEERPAHPTPETGESRVGSMAHLRSAPPGELPN